MRQKGFVLLPVIIIITLIGALGYFIYQNTQLRQNNEISATPIPTYTTNPTNTPSATNSTSNWETYTNSVNKYSIKYPPSYLRLICSEEELTLTRRGNDNRPGPIEMGSCARGGRYTLETMTYDAIQNPPEETKYYKVEKKEIILDGSPATQYIFTFTNIEDGPFPVWYTIAQLDKNGKSFQIYFDDKDNLPTFDIILSTFKLTQ